ncbi:hypothetical protein Pcinc_014817 [Petrolisthes cinctipes]|uniref:DDE-1 domain-containing protein n=1 Tax=Petrolisthes cinctipes TaxID=88211 RepID=A0AAE1KQB5_PETCI|nr:hypothetical protein Pcinc_014817 [Petrolisthes cinctipes]
MDVAREIYTGVAEKWGITQPQLFMESKGTCCCCLKPTIVYRATRPRAYKGHDEKKLNVHWLSSKKGCVSATLSFEWLKDCFIPDVAAYCKANNVHFNILLLLLDNAPRHSPLLQDRYPNARVEFLPPNTTSLIQPLDQEVISVVKASFSRRQLFRLMCQSTEDAALIQSLIDDNEDIDDDDDEDVDDDDNIRGDTECEQRVVRYWKQFHMKEAVDLLVSCWNDVIPLQSTMHA